VIVEEKDMVVLLKPAVMLKVPDVPLEVKVALTMSGFPGKKPAS
jgi:hypothetical protein